MGNAINHKGNKQILGQSQLTTLNAIPTFKSSVYKNENINIKDGYLFESVKKSNLSVNEFDPRSDW